MMADGEIDFVKSGPQAGETTWGARLPGKASMAAARPPAVEQPAQPRMDLAEGVADLIADEAALVHPLMQHVVAPAIGAPGAEAISMALLAAEIMDLLKDGPPPMTRPTVPVRWVEQTWGPDGPSPAALKCCRDAAAEGRACPMHPRPTMW